MKRRILIDLDATVVDIHTPWLHIYNDEFDDNLTLDRITGWEMADHAKPGILDILKRPGFFASMLPLAGAVEAVRELNERFEIFIVTAAEHAPNFGEKVEWVQRHLPFLSKRQLIVAHEKHLLTADAIIDDKPATAAQYKKTHPAALVLSIEYPYNRTEDAYAFLAPSWKDPAAAWSELRNYCQVYFFGEEGVRR